MDESQTETVPEAACAIASTSEGCGPPKIQTVLVVDDATMTLLLAGSLLSEALGVRITTARDGVQALKSMAEDLPTLVLTDLEMPNMNGLELVQEIRSAWPSMPVILMTAMGSEDVAFEALQAGASSYVPKSRLSEVLVPTAERLLSHAHNERRRNRVLDSLSAVDYRFVLENDPDLVCPLLNHLQEQLLRMNVCTENTMLRIAVALEEALLNAMYHGNLEISSDLKQDGGDAFQVMARARRCLDPWQARRVHFDASLSATGARFSIRDEGPGFDVSKLPDPTDPENMLLCSGRGLLLIRTFMSEVYHNDTGNRITMVYRKK